MAWDAAANAAALEAWKASGGHRPAQRPDGWPTRAAVELLNANVKVTAA